MAFVTPFLLLVFAGFGAFVAVLMIVSLRCWGLEAPRGDKDAMRPSSNQARADDHTSDRAAA